ncbi:MAG: glycosyltransferase [Acidobacteria bacterium]|nr:glycosyltransferase [Acidobacteriota bacterium]
MNVLTAALRVLGRLVFLVSAGPLLLMGALLTLCLSDLLPLRRRDDDSGDEIQTSAISVVIPNWNGRDLLAKNLPSVVEALAFNPANELIVVDNASADGSAEFLQKTFPEVTVLALAKNAGFGGGSNAGIQAALHDIVLLLNNDMRLAPGAAEALLAGFSDPRVFAVTSQIFFSDPAKRREETGLTQGQWTGGQLRVDHHADDQVTERFPTFYAGGGSSAYSRKKFLELGGFDALMEPFYYEDTDISYGAWKRGWVILYEPRSVVYHDHRGTIGKHFSDAYIRSVLQKNRLLFVWKNIHEWKRLAGHFGWLYAGLWTRTVFGPSSTRPTPRGLLRALRQLVPVVRARRNARRLSAIDDTEAFRRPLPGYFWDRFQPPRRQGEKLNVLFVSPYPIEPPIHGGAVFMKQTIEQLNRLTKVHLLCLLDEPGDLSPNQAFGKLCESAEFAVRWADLKSGIGSLVPHGPRSFYRDDFLWRLQRAILQHRADVVQLEYTQMAGYSADFQRIGMFLFEHDLSFQSVWRSIKGLRDPFARMRYLHEYLRLLRFEKKAVVNFDAVQVCTAANRRHLVSFAGNGTPIVDGMRAGIDVSRYEYVEQGREPDTLLFLGNFRHLPNQEALDFFTSRVWPGVRRERREARLIVAGAQAPPGFESRLRQPGIEFIGQVRDVRDVLSRYAVFVCPILSGSGVRVKLLEAFAAGIPAVSTPLGAEGLAERGADFVELAADAEGFADRVRTLLAEPQRGRKMARRARREVEQNWDMAVLTERLENHYRDVLRSKLERPETGRPAPLRDLSG